VIKFLDALIKLFMGEDNPIEFGDHSNPSIWRGIAIKQASAKLLSSIINQRLLRIINEHGVENQYGKQKVKGCRDGIFALKAALETRIQ
jgi:hypothetical protein